jgi:hypothetical protein
VLDIRRFGITASQKLIHDESEEAVVTSALSVITLLDVIQIGWK